MLALNDHVKALRISKNSIDLALVVTTITAVNCAYICRMKRLSASALLIGLSLLLTKDGLGK